MSGRFPGGGVRRVDTQEMVNQVRRRTGHKNDVVQEIVKAMIEQMRDEVASGSVIVYQWFGSFRAARDCRGKPRMSFMESKSMGMLLEERLPKEEPRG